MPPSRVNGGGKKWAYRRLSGILGKKKTRCGGQAGPSVTGCDSQRSLLGQDSEAQFVTGTDRRDGSLASQNGDHGGAIIGLDDFDGEVFPALGQLQAGAGITLLNGRELDEGEVWANR